MSDENSESLA